MNATRTTLRRLACLLAFAAMLPAASAREVTCRIEVDRTLLPANTTANAVIKVTLEAPDAPTAAARTPVNLCIVLDRSGSMSGAKIEHARLAAIEAVRRLHPDDIFSLVTYDSSIETVIPARHPRDLEWIEDQIRRIQPRGMTALFGGVSQGAAEIRKHLDGRFIHRIILLSDGIANVGPGTPEDLGRLGDSLLKENIHVSTIGVGLDYNEDLMTRLALRAGGNTYFVEDSADLPRILASELGEAQRVVAQRVILELLLPEGIRPVRVIGREGRLEHRRVEVPLHQLHGGQSRFALVEVQVPPQSPEATLELARARITYDDIATERQIRTSEQAVSVQFSARSEDVEASANLQVNLDLLENRRAEAQAEAIRLNDEGRRQEAATLMRGVAEDFDRVGNALHAPAAVQAGRELSVQAEVLEERGLDSRQRKVFRAESYQTIMQQK
ncbi:MAG TPA: VWA domain-containing protein [Kiritimatiellia bacterium]|nr:VWA domain-containing protein [Kiritimatiellia bacterium]